MIRGFIHRYLDPVDSLLEILFGLIMSLTLTVGARLLLRRDELSAPDLVAGLAGCNLAWGLIDAVFYLLGARLSRNIRARFVRRLQATRDDAYALALIDREFDVDPTLLRDEADRAAVRRALLDALRHANASRVGIGVDDCVGAAIICLLVAATALPAIVSLLLVDDTTLALRLANAAQTLLLFLVGYAWAQHAGANRWTTGATIASLAVGLVLVAVALGG